jgi:hypothetical protein
MVKKVVKKKVKKDSKDVCSPNSCNGGGFYGLGIVGAAVYYISTATGFWAGVLGILKALVWPAFLIYEALKFLGA